MARADDQTVLSDLLAKLDDPNNSGISKLCNEFSERELLFEKLYATSGFITHNTLAYSFYFDTDLGLLRKSIPLVSEACALLAQKTGIGNGYSIELRDFFHYPSVMMVGMEGTGVPVDGFHSLFLTLFEEESGKVAGVLDFKVGLPFQITAIQGGRNGEPQQFFKKTGLPFYQPLMEHFIKSLGAAVRFEKGDQQRVLPKAEFWLSERPSNKVMHGLLKYIYRRDWGKFLSNDSFSTTPLKGKPFFKAWRAVHPNPQPKQPLVVMR